ncbi:hypothetical protein MWN33_01610 [Starkeya koreensis]|uniref:DUF680 domain-containing protein n=1 Tax=Ancylobacter koreensis TaxID=266121 RepID=A0ABT0DHG2_9HYPH|nr:hypothetical protein [Ancylobacter koreensis]MCK0206723.1 hypothetical protein [Ancylobacter koreensis]
MNKFVALAIVSAAVATGALSGVAEAATYQPAKVYEGRNATVVTTDNSATAIREQVEGNARSTK